LLQSEREVHNYLSEVNTESTIIYLLANTDKLTGHLQSESKMSGD